MEVKNNKLQPNICSNSYTENKNREWSINSNLCLPSEDSKHDKTLSFYKTSKNVLNKIMKTKYVIVAGDLNARVGLISILRVVGCLGENVVNRNGQGLRQFTCFRKLKIMNTF